MDLDGISMFRKFVYLHKPQLESSGVPSHFWEYLYRKLTNQIFDAGDAFSLLLIDYDGNEGRDDEDPVWTVAISKDGGISCSDPSEIYIIDHAWSFRMDIARNQLQQMPDLLTRMCRIMGIDTDAENRIDLVMTSMWKYTQMYAIGGENIAVEDRMPVWYIMDELGSAINHSDTPNVRIVPFMLLPDQVTYSILFPIQDCEEGSYVVRDFVENTPINSRIRNALLLPWRHSLFTDVDFTQTEPDAEYFRSERVEETLPASDQHENSQSLETVEANRPLNVYAEYDVIRQYLTDPAFQLVDTEDQADILWLTKHYKDYNRLSMEFPAKFINQFPFENVITVKDLLSIVCRRLSKSENGALDTRPLWLPTTFNLKTELLQFVSYFQTRNQHSLDNHWIIKPWNLARGLDTYITKDLAQIMRLQPTGPKIVQKYIENPVLFHRSDIDAKVKFDVRYVILLVSVHPLKAYIHKNFFLRFANKAFQLNHYDDYQQHFTVMNYAENFPLLHITCAEFLELWHEQYPNIEWHTVEMDLCEMFKELLIGATMKEPPCGIGKSRQSRAVYAVDTMLAWDNGRIQPKLLEVNWTPDCQRACEYYPNFFNDIFKLLFLNEENNEIFYNFTK